ncbi:MAG: hypothetical protein Q9N67_11415 [Ghiorsea sp.]|nr:hypothetical protein [Ghiorsea sp.]
MGVIVSVLCVKWRKKLTPIGLAFLPSSRIELPEHCEIQFLYGDHQPVQMKSYPENIMEAYEPIQYRSDKMLKVKDVFQVNGLDTSYSQRWVWGQVPQAERYGVDAGFTRLVHDCYARGFDEGVSDPSTTTDWPAYTKWTAHSQATWKQEIAKKLDRLKLCYSKAKLNELAESLTAVVRSFNPNIKQRELTEAEYDELKKDGWINEKGGMQLGYRFEEAVWHRTRIEISAFHCMQNINRLLKSVFLVLRSQKRWGW